jgi:putative transposase
MVDLFLLSQTQMRRIERYFPLSHGIAQVDDWRIVSAIVFVIKNGLRWRDAPSAYGPHETIYNRFVRWSRLGVFNKIFAELARKGGKPKRIMIDATHRAAAYRSARWRINEWLGLNAHVGHACRAIEHPGRNLERPRYIRAVQRATEDAIGPLGRAVNKNVAPEPGMKPIKKLSAHRPVGVPKPRCTTRFGRMGQSATSPGFPRRKTLPSGGPRLIADQSPPCPPRL